MSAHTPTPWRFTGAFIQGTMGTLRPTIAKMDANRDSAETSPIAAAQTACRSAPQ